ncbi:olfactory receptor 6N1-like [Pelobates fuscus]|uniref:olfactory receptor 6N1-like n=1 Tax=Pelobates fuscus TaxID=191477 RepID=UPI002FE4A840
MKSDEIYNFTNEHEFTFLGFPALNKAPVTSFLIMLIIYVINAVENMLIIIVTRIDSHLNKPMYYFIGFLSLVDISCASIVLPKMLTIILSNKNTISFLGCMTQMYVFLAVGITESFLLTIMSYDRYVAICNPLRYYVIMTEKCCRLLVLGCWISGFLAVILPVGIISRLPFCKSHVINHFFCDISPVIQLSCSDIQRLQLFFTFIASVVIIGSFPIIILSYVQIALTILDAPSPASKKKTFSTCAAHLTVVLIYYGSISFMYIRPSSKTNLDLDKITSLFYSVLTPTMNPLIYSLRNDEIKNALKKLLGRKTKINSQD